MNLYDYEAAKAIEAGLEISPSARKAVTAHQEALLGDDIGRSALRDDILVVGPTSELVITVFGEPKSQGNLTKGRWGGVYEKDSVKVQPWREAICANAQEAMRLTDPDVVFPLHRLGTAVAVKVTFSVPRLLSHFGTGKTTQHVLKADAPAWPPGGKDIDKMARAVLDSIAAAGVIQDDKQVAALTAIKRYVRRDGVDFDALEIQGAVIRVRAL